MRKYEETVISQVEDFVPEVPPMRGFQQSNFYRGHADHSWELTPSLFRTNLQETASSGWIELAEATQLKFKQLTPPEIRSQMHSELEWGAVASHHQSPSHFSTWSESALVGLYFATEETSAKTDGAVWRLMPGFDEMTIYQDYEQVKDAPRIYRPQFQTPEMTAQRVCFLTHPFPDSDSPIISFENYYNSSDDLMNLSKIIIPHHCKAQIRQQIAALGFDSRSIFPGLKGIGLQVSNEIYNHTQSYEWLM